MSVCGPDGFPEDDGRHGVEGVVVGGARGKSVNGANDDASLGDRQTALRQLTRGRRLGRRR